ncbi:MAG: alpha/beta hydrolase fold protein [Marmoricola sp.]|nr:alpha/beta hydrolase fold protein [Marmoricola sp.]
MTAERVANSGAPGRPMQVYSSDGTRLHALVFGPEGAPTIVLSHGITNDNTAWQYQIEALSDRFRVVAYDQRGHGQSAPAARERLSVEALAEDVQAILEKCVPAGERVVLAGHSMGGISIMSWAQRHSGEVELRVAAVLLLNTAANGILDHIALVGIPRPAHGVARAVVRQRLLAVIRGSSTRPLRYLVFGDVARTEDLAHLRRMIRQCPPQTLHGFIQSLTRMELLGGLSALTVPVVVYAGQRDRLLPPVHSRRIAKRLPKLETFVIRPGVGHMGQFESAEEVAFVLSDLAERYLP